MSTELVYEGLTLVFRCIHGQAPDYLCALIQPAPMSKPGLRSESRDALLRVPLTRHKLLIGDLALMAKSCGIAYLAKIRFINDYGKFTSDLKTWLFDIF